MNVHAAYLAIITFRSGVTDEDQRDRRLAYIVYGLNHVSHARFQSLAAIQSMFLHRGFCIVQIIELVVLCVAHFIFALHKNKYHIQQCCIQKMWLRGAN